jgi:serine/threonine protein kinase
LKLISQSDIINVEREINFHKKIDHPNIIKFYDYTKKEEEKKVLILLEYAERGDLFSFLNKSEALNEKTACKYFVQTALGLNYIHSLKTIHRDIKPENILLDGKLDAKICDFGWSAEYDENTRRQTVCGTYEYMAPEILFKKQQDEGIDIWALGILLYELLHNYAPYSGRSMSEVSKKIISKKLEFASTIAEDARSLIQRILKQNPKERPSIKEILKDPFVQRNYGPIDPSLIKEIHGKEAKKTKETLQVTKPTISVPAQSNHTKASSFSLPQGLSVSTPQNQQPVFKNALGSESHNNSRTNLSQHLAQVVPSNIHYGPNTAAHFPPYQSGNNKGLSPTPQNLVLTKQSNIQYNLVNNYTVKPNDHNGTSNTSFKNSNEPQIAQQQPQKTSVQTPSVNSDIEKIVQKHSINPNQYQTNDQFKNQNEPTKLKYDFKRSQTNPNILSSLDNSSNKPFSNSQGYAGIEFGKDIHYWTSVDTNAESIKAKAQVRNQAENSSFHAHDSLAIKMTKNSTPTILQPEKNSSFITTMNTNRVLIKQNSFGVSNPISERFYVSNQSQGYQENPQPR